MGRGVGTDEERSLYYKFKKKLPTIDSSFIIKSQDNKENQKNVIIVSVTTSIKTIVKTSLTRIYTPGLEQTNIKGLQKYLCLNRK